MEEIKKRFLSKVTDTPSGCQVWKAARDAAGYGRFWFEGRMMPASQAAYRLFVGEIPKGLVIRHKCLRKDCVNVEHLLLGTQAENMIDLALGRKLPHWKVDFEEARELRKRGWPLEVVAEKFGTSRQAIFQGLKRHYGTATFPHD